MAKIWFAIALLWAGSAAAVDGVIEIDQAKADAGAVNGSLASDPAGFPVVITQPGSYRLTGNLTVPDANTTAIQVTVAQVDIDLNGFAILGPHTYNGAPAPCTGTGSGSGIESAYAIAHVSVHDGTVKGMGSHGVLLGDWSSISHVTVQENGGSGGTVASSSIVSANRVIRNCGVGISTNVVGSIRANVVSGNLLNGLYTSGYSSIEANIVTGNGGAGWCGIGSSGDPNAGRDNIVTDNPAGCSGGSCCSLGWPLGLLGCNLIQNAAGTVQRCCPNPPGPDVCF